MLKFVSLAAREGRVKIASETVKKILPGVENWDHRNNLVYNHMKKYSNSPSKLTVLYKHIKHNIIPNKSTEDARSLFDAFARQVLPFDRPNSASSGPGSNHVTDHERILYSRIYSRQAELNRKYLNGNIARKEFNLYSDVQKQTITKYEQALQMLKEINSIAEPTYINRHYKVVHCFASFALDCVEYWREHDRELRNQIYKQEINERNRRTQGHSQYSCQGSHAQYGVARASSEPVMNTDQRHEAASSFTSDNGTIRPKASTVPVNGNDHLHSRNARDVIDQLRGGFHNNIREYSQLALKYFFQSVNLSQRSVLQDMLRILRIMADFNRDIDDLGRNDPGKIQLMQAVLLELLILF